MDSCIATRLRFLLGQTNDFVACSKKLYRTLVANVLSIPAEKARLSNRVNENGALAVHQTMANILGHHLEVSAHSCGSIEDPVLVQVRDILGDNEGSNTGTTDFWLDEESSKGRIRFWERKAFFHAAV